MGRYPAKSDVVEIVERADTHLYAGEWKAAIELYTRALSREPNCVYVLVQRGLALQEENRLNEAIKDYNLALGLDPDYGPAFYGRSRARHGQRDFHGELADAKSGLELDPEKAAMYRRQTGAAYMGLKRYADALLEYTQVLDVLPDDAGTLCNRAFCFIQMGNWQSAVADLDRALEIDPSREWALRQRALAHEQMGRLDEALSDYHALLERNHRDNEAADGRERVLLKKSKSGSGKLLRRLFGRE